MEESAISTNWKEKTSSKKLLDANASSSKEARKSISSRTSSKFGWKSFFRIFRKSKKICSPKQSQFEVAKKDKDSNEVFLNDLDDTLAMAISLPEKVNGKDVQVSIELKAIGKQDILGSETGLKVAEETLSKTTFAGNIKIPSDTTIEQVANMPLYFVNAEKSLSGKGKLSNKIETVIKPLEDNLPVNVDKSMIVTNINLKVNLQNLDWKCKKSNEGEKLNYIFISNDENRSKSSLRSKTDDIIEEISQTNMVYNEQSKMIVKDILSQVIEKVETHDMSTQYSSITECVNKEIDVQKNLLLKKGIESDSECSSLQTELLSRISEEKEETDIPNLEISRTSEESLYPSTTTTHTRVSTLSITESEGSMYYLKAPTNTPNHQVPKYMIKYDDRSSRSNSVKHEISKSFVKLQSEIIVNKANETSVKLHTSKSDIDYVNLTQIPNKIYYDRRNKIFYHQVLHEDIRADIDKTLELLETAKNKLLSYLDNAMDLVDFTRDYKYKYPQIVSPAAILEEMKTKQMIPQKKSTRSFKDSEQFFLGETKNEDLISFSTESLNIDRVPKLNTIQNIYNEDVPEVNIIPQIESVNKNICNENVSTLTKEQVNFGEILKERYSVDCKTNNLTYNIVENDINFMIRELLNESNNIKELVLENVNKEIGITTEVNSVLEDVLAQVVPFQGLVEDLDAPKINQKPVCISYCLIDENNHMDTTKALLDLPKLNFTTVEKQKLSFVNKTCVSDKQSETLTGLNKMHQEKGNTIIEDKLCEKKQTFALIDQTQIQITKSDEVKKDTPRMQKEKTLSSKSAAIVYRPQKHGEYRSVPRISVKKVSPSKKHHILKSDDNLTQRLEKGTTFLRNIYSEICSCHYEYSADSNHVAENINQSNEKVGTSKASSIEIKQTQEFKACEEEIKDDKNENKCNLEIPQRLLMEQSSSQTLQNVIEEDDQKTRQNSNVEQRTEESQRCLDMNARSRSNYSFRNNILNNNLQNSEFKDNGMFEIMNIEEKTNLMIDLKDGKQSERDISDMIIFKNLSVKNHNNREVQQNSLIDQNQESEESLNENEFINIKHSIKEMSFPISEYIGSRYHSVQNKTLKTSDSKSITGCRNAANDIGIFKENNCKTITCILGSTSLESCITAISQNSNLKEYVTTSDLHITTMKPHHNDVLKGNVDYYKSDKSAENVISNGKFILDNTENVITVLQQRNSNSKQLTNKSNSISKSAHSDSLNKASKKGDKKILKTKETSTLVEDDNFVDMRDNQDQPINPPQELHLLKKAAKILKQVEIDEKKHMTSQEEILQMTYDLKPNVAEKKSSYSFTRQRREKQFQYSSSSSEEQIRPARKVPPTSKLVSQAASYAICKKSYNPKVEVKESSPVSIKSVDPNTTKKASNSETSSYNSLKLSCTDYDADHEISSYALPYFRYEYESREDLNNENEVEFIENNAAANLKLNTPGEVFSTTERPLLCESIESIETPSIDSETSLEKTDYTYKKI